MLSLIRVTLSRSDDGALCRASQCRHMVVALALGLLYAAPGPLGAADAELLSALNSGGHFALLRHAIAPGTGDPVGFKLHDCSTQRNLSDDGRDQATRIGARLRVNGIQTARVFSSQWCRCLETADLLGIGPVEELPFLNSFFQQFENRGPQTQALKEWLASQELNEVVVLVTHQVNVTALVDVYPLSGELVVVRRLETGDLAVVGTIKFD